MFEIGQQEIDAVAEVINSHRLFRYTDTETGRAYACEAVADSLCRAARDADLKPKTQA